MELKMFAIHDMKLGAFMSPMFFRSNGEAIRSFLDEAVRPDSKIQAHPADYALYGIGWWDDETGCFTAYEQIAPLCRGTDAGVDQ